MYVAGPNEKQGGGVQEDERLKAKPVLGLDRFHKFLPTRSVSTFMKNGCTLILRAMAE